MAALSIPVALTAFRVRPRVGQAVAGFADPVVFLPPGVVPAEALQRHGTDRRIACHVLDAVGTSPHRIVFPAMLATATLSTGISNRGRIRGRATRVDRALLV